LERLIGELDFQVGDAFLPGLLQADLDRRMRGSPADPELEEETLEKSGEPL
jgi:hypothetical protein